MKYLAPLLFVLFLQACNSTPPTPVVEEVKKPKNIILLIGDGMGLSQVSSAYYYKEGTPNFSRFKHVGLSRTSTAKQKVTDSASGATAFSAGVKTYNGAIGMDVDTMAVPTIVEILSEQSWKTGVISTSSITHATPACFYAHVKLRGMQDEIAAQLVESDIDFFAGGGQEYFSGNINGRNTFEKLKAAGYTVDTTSLDGAVAADQRYGYLLDDDGMPRMLDGRGDFLGQSTQKALGYFDLSENPFFLMIEGSQIDWGGHDNEEDYLVSELLDFDEVIGQVLDYAAQDGETLVIVTADHETAGYTLASNDGDYAEVKGAFATDGHSATLVPVFAFGPGAEAFSGVYENNSIFHKMMKAVGK
ncbi:MAG: alkaline phosphatase [Cyclobacteriaceae bacterium]